MLIDSQLHLVDEDYDIDEVIKRANDNGVKYLIVSGSDRIDNFLNIELLSNYDNIFFSVGFHPDCAGKVGDEDFSRLEKLILNKKVVAIGEIGLDYFHDKSNKDSQKELFVRQLEIAEKYDLPVVIHTRDAFLDTYNILKEHDVKGVIHCFSGSLEVALKYMDLGFYLGIGGVVTFKNSNLKNVIEKIGIEKVVFETDSPYLSPFRGEKNEPCNVKEVCLFVANLLGFSFDKVANITTSNAMKLFDLSSKI